MTPHYNIMHLFPSPVYVSNIDPELTEKELSFVHDQSLYKEFPNQNYASKTMNILNHPMMERIKKIVQSHLHNYATEVMGIDSELVHTTSWLNRNPPGTLHSRHKHVNSFASGVVYFTDPAPIEFHTTRTVVRADIKVNVKQHNIYNSNDWWLPVKKNNIILFPSYIDHSVLTNTSNEDRISLSFNTFVKGTMGRVYEPDFIDFDDLEMTSSKYL
jgi:uncharacterized protein (TIGR02466 family)